MVVILWRPYKIQSGKVTIMPLDTKKYVSELLQISSADEFCNLAFKAFAFQYENNAVYRQYCNYLNVDASKIHNLCDIPFMPVEFFKTHKVVSSNQPHETIFTSSTTTGNVPSSHFVISTQVYKQTFLQGFERFYGNPEQYCILGLLPAYLERTGSSLVYMVDELIKLSNNKLSGFFLHNHKALYDTISLLEQQKQKYVLIGVSFALLDFAESYNLHFENGIIMETGGMKGRRKEMIRSELHEILQKAFSVSEIHSEYGMTELLSQAYSRGNGIYECSPTMKVLVRELNDPLSVSTIGSGAVNIIDLANIYSCCFLQTSDLGSAEASGKFSISGRFDTAEVRGCNLMANM